jgi:hypothetical protein
VGRVGNLPTIFKYDCLSTPHVEIKGVHMDLCLEAGVARPREEVIRTFHTDSTNWRVMADLFQEDTRSIVKCSLKGFSQDWVQWLLKRMARLKER